jgi:hypothetical protein
MAEKDNKNRASEAESKKKANRTLKVILTPSVHTLVTLAANLREETIADYLARVVAEASLGDTQDMNKVRIEVDNNLKAKRK